ncbi:hypothetical protein GCM10007940_21890 [Portibacter lacus]|uniref:YfhO family protein n=2 Tax=Portibacter lacus TaxID=1099794 RepID=A0AA37SQJ6_9BACT|nr:hypothetical protein GCM10007940_21890 [Portibacter lacus]
MAIVFLSLIEGVVLSYPALNNRKAIKADRFASRELYNDYSLEALKYIESIEDGFYRVEKTYGSVLSGLNDSQAQDYFDTRSYRSHNHNNYINFIYALDMMDPQDELATRWLQGLGTVAELHPFFHIKYMLAKSGEESNAIKLNYENLGELNGINIYKSKFPIPFGFPVESYITESEFKSLSSYYKRLSTLYTSAIIPDDEAGEYPNLAKKDATTIFSSLALESYSLNNVGKGLDITSFSQSKITGSIELSAPSMIIFTFPFDEGWRVNVDGKKSSLSYVDNGLTGLYIEEGSHEIVLKYRPPFYEYGLVLFLLGLGALIYFGLFKEPKSKAPFLIPMELKSNIEKADEKSPSKTIGSKKSRKIK